MTGETPLKPQSRHQEILMAGTAFVIFFLLVALWPRRADVTQPIDYSHQKHLALDMECSNCHTLYAESPWAGLPTIDACSLCHSEPSLGTQEEAKIVAYVQKEKTPPWQQINQLPTHVYFSHQTHVQSARIDCVGCHGEMKQLTSPPAAPLFSWTMDTCLECHEERRATLDCNGCHR
jgi:hypothetical protein